MDYLRGTSRLTKWGFALVFAIIYYLILYYQPSTYNVHTESWLVSALIKAGLIKVNQFALSSYLIVPITIIGLLILFNLAIKRQLIKGHNVLLSFLVSYVISIVIYHSKLIGLIPLELRVIVSVLAALIIAIILLKIIGQTVGRILVRAESQKIIYLMLLVFLYLTSALLSLSVNKIPQDQIFPYSYSHELSWIYLTSQSGKVLYLSPTELEARTYAKPAHVVLSDKIVDSNIATLSPLMLPNHLDRILPTLKNVGVSWIVIDRISLDSNIKFVNSDFTLDNSSLSLDSVSSELEGISIYFIPEIEKDQQLDANNEVYVINEGIKYKTGSQVEINNDTIIDRLELKVDRQNNSDTMSVIGLPNPIDKLARTTFTTSKDLRNSELIYSIGKSFSESSLNSEGQRWGLNNVKYSDLSKINLFALTDTNNVAEIFKWAEFTDCDGKVIKVNLSNTKKQLVISSDQDFCINLRPILFENLSNNLMVDNLKFLTDHKVSICVKLKEKGDCVYASNKKVDKLENKYPIGVKQRIMVEVKVERSIPSRTIEVVVGGEIKEFSLVSHYNLQPKENFTFDTENDLAIISGSNIIVNINFSDCTKLEQDCFLYEVAADSYNGYGLLSVSPSTDYPTSICLGTAISNACTKSHIIETPTLVFWTNSVSQIMTNKPIQGATLMPVNLNFLSPFVLK